MKINPSAQLSQYKFSDEGWGFISSIFNLLDNISGMGEINLPLRESGLFRALRRIWRLLTGKYSIFFAIELLGIENEGNRSILAWHDKRLRNMILWAGISAFLVYVGSMLTLVILEISFPQISDFLFTVGGLFILFFYLMLIFAYRLVFLFMKKDYADTICLMNTLYLLLELFHPEGINTPKHRRRIQKRMQYLANGILLLSQHYESTSSENDNYIKTHFHAMEEFVREREKWVVLPTLETLEKLRSDFAGLLPFFINANYGDFPVPASNKQEKVEETPYWRKMATGILGFIGLVIPIFSLLNIYIFNPNIVPEKADLNTLTVILIAWFLLTFDSIFKVGIIESFTKLVQTARQLK